MFNGRWDDFTLQQELNSEGKTPYWRQGKALEDEDIAAHLYGWQTIGIYPINPKDHAVRFVVIDLDFNDFAEMDFEVVRKVLKAAKKLGIRVEQILIEFSGRRGYHVWIFFSDPVPAATAGRLGKGIVDLGGVQKYEIFPKQDEVREGGFGNPIKLPLCVHKASGKRSCFLDEDGKEIVDWQAHLGSRSFLDKVQLDSILQSLGPDAESEVNNGDMAPLVQKYGPPYYLGEKGSFAGINQSFWAGLHHSEHIEVYDPDERSFYRYDSKTGLYQVVSEDVLKQEISERMLEVSRKMSVPALEMKRTNDTLSQIVAHLKGICEKRGVFRGGKKIIHLANGVLIFRDNGEADFCEFSPEHYSRNQYPVVYDPKATCTRFLEELLRPAVNVDDLILFQKYFGVCLLGDNLIQRLLILDGMPNRGKSTISNVVQGIIGQDNVTQLRTNQLNSKFELFRYLKKKLLVGVDVPGDFMSEAGAQVIKGLVGGDMFDAEQKNGTGSFTFKGIFCVLITCNSRLHVRLNGDVGAWQRRLLIIKFDGSRPAKNIPNFSDLLVKDEGSGILNFALKGLALVLREVAEIGDIRLTVAQAGKVDALLAESDGVRHFLMDTVMRDEGHDLTTNEIVEAYAKYCPEKGWHPKPITVVYNELETLMLELFRTARANSIMRDGKSGRGFRNVRFKNQEGCV